MIGLNTFSHLSGTVLLLFLLGFWKQNIREQQAGRYVSISKMDIFPYKEPELMIRVCFFLGLRFLFGYVSISSAYAVNVSYVTSSIKSSPIIQGTERQERQQTNPIHRDLRISKETMYIYIYTPVYILYVYDIMHWHFIVHFLVVSSRRNRCQQLLLLLFQLRGWRTWPKDSWLVGLGQVGDMNQGTGNQWVQHCQESWLALVPGPKGTGKNVWDFR